MTEEKQNEIMDPELEPWDPKAEAEEEIELERGDRFAMMAAGCLTVALPVGLLIAFISAVTILLFSR